MVQITAGCTHCQVLKSLLTNRLLPNWNIVDNFMASVGREFQLVPCWMATLVAEYLKQQIITRNGCSPTGIDKMASMGRKLRHRPCKDADRPSKIFTTCTRGSCSATVARPLMFEIVFLYKFCVMLIFATTDLLSTTSASSNLNTSATSFNFSVEGTSYECSSNVICLGLAHKYTGAETNGIRPGMLSLVTEDLYSIADSAGIAYFNMPVRLLDFATGQSASFATSFKMDARTIILGTYGDGMTFFLSENNDILGSTGRDFGIFHNGITSYKTIVVEFDTYQNPDAVYNDINSNHVSLDFSNVTSIATANASRIGISLGDNTTIHAWVEYSNETQQLEVRVSYDESRPISPLVNHTVNLFDVAAEYMWVGFSGANAGSLKGWTSNYYVGDWKFESYGIAPSGLAQVEKVVYRTGFIVGISLAGAALVLATTFVVFTVKRLSGSHLKQRFPKENLMQVEGMPEKFTYEDLCVATNNFSEESKLGQGGFGSVYRGLLPSSSSEVAVKKINSNSTQGEKEFMAEVSIINQSRHRNLIQLRGWCKDTSKRQYLLVYELMSNGSLDRWLFWPAEQGKACLSWPQRFNIVKGIALAVEYLHQGCVRQVIHRDIKSSNIMLDESFNVKLGDFGLSRLVDHQDAAPTTGVSSGTLGYIAPEVTMLAGTPGYIAPEALNTGKCTEKTDVYASGVVLLEVACGRKAYLQWLPCEEMVLVDWVWHRMMENRLLTVVERRLGESYDRIWMEVMLKVGLLCTHDDSESRPSMGEVVRMLAGDIPVPPIPPRRSTKRVTINDFLNPNYWAASKPESIKLVLDILSDQSSTTVIRSPTKD